MRARYVQGFGVRLTAPPDGDVAPRLSDTWEETLKVQSTRRAGMARKSQRTRDTTAPVAAAERLHAYFSTASPSVPPDSV